jgi:hypothetical protein
MPRKFYDSIDTNVNSLHIFAASVDDRGRKADAQKCGMNGKLPNLTPAADPGNMGRLRASGWMAKRGDMSAVKSLFLGMLLALLAADVLADPASAPVTSAAPSPAAQPTVPAPATGAPATNAPAAAAPDATQATPPAGQSEEDSYTYVTGYSDGCASANLRYARQEHVKPNKDATLYDSDKGYHDGWNHGYRKCEDHVTPGALPVPGNSVIM